MELQLAGLHPILPPVTASKFQAAAMPIHTTKKNSGRGVIA